MHYNEDYKTVQSRPSIHGQFGYAWTLIYYSGGIVTNLYVAGVSVSFFRIWLHFSVDQVNGQESHTSTHEL